MPKINEGQGKGKYKQSVNVKPNPSAQRLVGGEEKQNKRGKREGTKKPQRQKSAIQLVVSTWVPNICEVASQ